MKKISFFVAAGLILAAGGAFRHVSAQAQQPAEKPAPLRDPLADWQYPGAKIWGESNTERLPTIPLHTIHSKIADPIDTVCQFYLKKCDPHLTADKHNEWRQEFQVTLLMTQLEPGSQSTSCFHVPRKDASSALLIIRQLKRTITVQLSRDPQDKSTTDILLVADEH